MTPESRFGLFFNIERLLLIDLVKEMVTAFKMFSVTLYAANTFVITPNAQTLPTKMTRVIQCQNLQ